MHWSAAHDMHLAPLCMCTHACICRATLPTQDLEPATVLDCWFIKHSDTAEKGVLCNLAGPNHGKAQFAQFGFANGHSSFLKPL